jgi:hypothetical protein
MHLTIHVVFTHPSDRGYDTEWLKLILLMGMGNASLLSPNNIPPQHFHNPMEQCGQAFLTTIQGQDSRNHFFFFFFFF